MRMGQVTELIGRHRNTILKYVERYEEFLSPQVAKGEHRQFTDEEVRILAFIGKLSDSGMDHDSIKQVIKQKISEGKTFPPVQAVPQSADSQALVPAALMETRIAAVNAELRELQARLDEVRQQAELRIAEMRRAGEIRDKEHMAELARLNQEIGRLQAKLEEAQRQSK